MIWLHKNSFQSSATINQAAYCLHLSCNWGVSSSKGLLLLSLFNLWFTVLLLMFRSVTSFSLKLCFWHSQFFILPLFHDPWIKNIFYLFGSLSVSLTPPQCSILISSTIDELIMFSLLVISVWFPSTIGELIYVSDLSLRQASRRWCHQPPKTCDILLHGISQHRLV